MTSVSSPNRVHLVGSIGLDRATWPTVWFKGGSEPGVLSMTWLLQRKGARTSARSGHGSVLP